MFSQELDICCTFGANIPTQMTVMTKRSFQFQTKLQGEPFFILRADLGQPGEGGVGVADLTCRTGGFLAQGPRAAPAGQEAKQKSLTPLQKLTYVYEICYHVV